MDLPHLISEAIMKLVPGLSCDIRTLLAKAKTFEQDLTRVVRAKRFCDKSVWIAS